jgi:hypothetical protein
MARISTRYRVKPVCTGADDKIVQRVLRHAKPHVTRERYIQSIRASSAGCDAENASEPKRAAFWPVIGQCFFAV